MCPSLHGCCEGALRSIVPFFIRLRSIGFRSEFETFFLSIRQIVADLYGTKSQKMIFSKQSFLCFPKNTEIHPHKMWHNFLKTLCSTLQTYNYGNNVLVPLATIQMERCFLFLFKYLVALVRNFQHLGRTMKQTMKWNYKMSESLRTYSEPDRRVCRSAFMFKFSLSL